MASSAELLPVGYDEALALLDRAPELRARAAAAQQLRAAADHVTSLPSDLAVSVEAGPRLIPEIAAQGRVAISQGFALAPLGAARRGVLDSRSGSLDAERGAERLARRVQVSEAWLRVHAAHAVLQISQAELTLAQALSRATQRSAELGELTAADAADAIAYAAEAELAVLSSEGDLTDARLELTRSLAISSGVLDARGDPPRISAPNAQLRQQLHARIDRLPALQSLLRAVGLLDAREREVRALYAPQVSLGVVLDRTDPTAIATLGLLGFTLPLANRGQREQAELSADRTALLGQVQERQADLRVEVERLWHDIEHTERTLRYADEQLLPAVQKGLDAREALFRAREGTLLEVILARRAALGLRMRRERLQSDWLSALTRFRELARAVGVEP